VRELIEWLYKADNDLQYGEIVVTIKKHQGQIVSIEKQITFKEKKSLKGKYDIP